MIAVAGQKVRINTPGESHHGRTGTVLAVPRPDFLGRILVDLEDVRWYYFPHELDAAEEV